MQTARRRQQRQPGRCRCTATAATAAAAGRRCLVVVSSASSARLRSTIRASVGAVPVGADGRGANAGTDEAAQRRRLPGLTRCSRPAFPAAAQVAQGAGLARRGGTFTNLRRCRGRLPLGYYPAHRKLQPSPAALLAGARLAKRGVLAMPNAAADGHCAYSASAKPRNP